MVGKKKKSHKIQGKGGEHLTQSPIYFSNKKELFFGVFSIFAIKWRQGRVVAGVLVILILSTKPVITPCEVLAKIFMSSLFKMYQPYQILLRVLGG